MKTKGNLETLTTKECEDCDLIFHQNVQFCPICDKDLIEIITVIKNK